MDVDKTKTEELTSPLQPSQHYPADDPTTYTVAKPVKDQTTTISNKPTTSQSSDTTPQQQQPPSLIRQSSSSSSFNVFARRSIFSLHSLSSFDKKSLSSIPEDEEYSTKKKMKGMKVMNTTSSSEAGKGTSDFISGGGNDKQRKQLRREDSTSISLLSNFSQDSKDKTGRRHHRDRSHGNQTNDTQTVHQLILQTIREAGVGKVILITLLVTVLCIGGYLFGVLMKSK